MTSSARPHRAIPERTERRAADMATRVRVDQSGCHIWTGAKNAAGYGYFSISGQVYLAHRVSLAWVSGVSQTELTCDHLCGIPSCVNPDHLEWVTQWVNNARGGGWSGQHVRATACPHGHAYDAENTRIRPSGRRACRSCERIYEQNRQPRKRVAA